MGLVVVVVVGGGGELDCSHLLFPSVKGVLQWSKSLFGNKRKIG